MSKLLRPSLALCAALLGCGALAACSTSSTGTAAPTTSATSQAAAVLVVDDAWIKTAPSGMTAIFGTLRNISGRPVTVVSATTSVSDRIELHEVVDTAGRPVMAAKQGGFVVAANASHVLEPGGDHFMVMNLNKPVQAGEQVTATLTLADGGTVRITALAKDTTAGQEKYHSESGTSSTTTAP